MYTLAQAGAVLVLHGLGLQRFLTQLVELGRGRTKAMLMLYTEARYPSIRHSVILSGVPGNFTYCTAVTLPRSHLFQYQT